MTTFNAQDLTHIVMFSGGAASWATAKRVVERHGADNTLLVFADTKMEDEDLYRFLDEATADIGAELVTLADGRTPWEVFRDVRFLGNTRIDPCSRILKRDLIRKWLENNHDPANTVVYLGYDFTEAHRQDRAHAYWAPWKVESPLLDKPLLTKHEILTQLREAGIEPPRLYEMGFPHNNCGGFCVKAGQAHFKRLLIAMPERYAWHEQQEQALRQELGDVAILRDRTGGETRPLTMREFREQLQAGRPCDESDWGGCGCFEQQELPL